MDPAAGRGEGAMTLWLMLVAGAHINAALRFTYHASLKRSPWVDQAALRAYHRRSLSWKDYRRLYGHDED